MAAFQHYEPLTEVDSIRLLVLQPARDQDAELKGNLVATTLRDCNYDILEPYIALSYVWGSDEKPCKIYLEGRVAYITASLDRALRSLRDEARPCRIWADALCIDQSNLQERTSQVRLMGDIYSAANSTIIHLGDSTTELSDLLRLVQPRWSKSEVNLNDQRNAGIVEAAKQDLLDRKWLTRVWVFQELVLSRDPWVMCGRTRARWADVCQVLLGQEEEGPAKSLEGAMDRLAIIRNMELNRKTVERLHLYEILAARRGLGAKDPRDFVFAHLGIIRDLQIVSNYVHVDYSEPPAHTFAKAAMYMYDQLGAEQTIHYVGVRTLSPDKRIPGLPTWAPNWSQRKLNPVPMYTSHPGLHKRVGRTTHAFVELGSRFVLCQVGRAEAKIDAVSRILPPSSQVDWTSWDMEDNYETMYEVQRELYWVRPLDEFLDSVDPEQGYQGPEDPSLDRFKKSCRKVGKIWSRFMQQVADTQEHSTGNYAEFASFFSKWIDQAAEEKRRIVAAVNRADSVDRGLYKYFQPKTAPKLLEGKRLAKCGSMCAIVPAEARKDDLIVHLASSPTTVLVREHAPQYTDKEAKVMRDKIEKANCGVNTSAREIRKSFWDVSDGLYRVRACVLLGEAYLEKWSAIKPAIRPPQESETEVFAIE